MSAVDLAALSTTERASLLATLLAEMPDTRYRDQTAMGTDVIDYLAFKRWKGMDERTVLARESQLGLFATDHPTLTVADFSGRDGARMIESFLIRRWGDKQPGTRANRTITLRDFFKWAYRDGRVEHDPMGFVDTPSRRGKRRDAHERAKILRLLAAQTRRRDRLAITLMARQGFRKNELRTFQLGHVDSQQRTVSIFGKGSKFAILPLFDDVAEDLDRYSLERAFENPQGWRTEYLVYRIHSWKAGGWPSYQQVERHDRDRPLSPSGIQDWWEKRLKAADIPHFPMHELRHTAGTDFHHGPAQGDYELTRQFLRHENVQTTAGYIHTANVALARAMRGWKEPESVQ